jgi:acyl-CoA hydrolase
MHGDVAHIERRTEIVFPQDANSHGTLFGGKAVSLMDEVGGILATRFCRKPVVTASIDRLDFKNPIKVGHFVEVIARIDRVGQTSMAIQIELWSEDPGSGARLLSTSADFVFVAIDANGHPTPVRD